MELFIPQDVKNIIDKFYKNEHRAFLVGGCVRDSILQTIPNDYDITTSALPDETINLFEKTIPTGLQHGTVTVLINKEPYEVTTFRTDGDYKDNRRPDSVSFVSDIVEDLSRRDFTINALAYNHYDGLIDCFNGLKDIESKIIKCVGNPDKRFNEDALRMLRAIRFSCQLDFIIESETYESIKRNYKLVENISSERVRDELCKILISKNSTKGLELLKATRILEIILPDINNLVEYTPKCNNHNRDVFKHTLKVIDNTYSNLILRLSALFHDVGKINTMTFLENGHCYFPKHSIESAIMTKSILTKLAFDNITINRVCSIIYEHLVLNVSYMPTDGEIKRLINKVGSENISLLYDLQRADINALWDPVPFLKKVDFMNERTQVILANKEPLIIKDLNITGTFLMSELNLKPSKLIGELLNFLLEKVLDNSSLNTKSTLLQLTKDYLNHLPKITS
ncbi:CCA tRNA nucleotidyltransferase [Clostridium gasigenes]|uniref:CCA tRNA nucleotidyltransferase n=1 Tax=Clostridium gasigenes TaxID=94869 RepID=UPI001438407E|nr:CCA tRNA nucleotidyltransferase [Clostridium gasigenes]NKF07918.1 CCA tRNA nucleotidyltransferase [Clostridium gasigenes]QSW20702.1 CCA tRNA nucleotidyltransferase [Clostridium gasigenes]